MLKGIDGKSVVVGVIATLVVLKFIAPKVPALAGLAAKVS